MSIETDIKNVLMTEQMAFCRCLIVDHIERVTAAQIIFEIIDRSQAEDILLDLKLSFEDLLKAYDTFSLRFPYTTNEV